VTIPGSSALPGSAEGKPFDVPVSGTFIGRARELHAIHKRIDSGARLVTITGAAGMGKTRLALEWARGAAAALGPEAVRPVFCELGETREIDDACAVVARAVAVPLSAEGTADEAAVQLGRALGELGRCVLILDNMEQLAAVAPRILGPWLRLAAQVQLLVTSRERLRLEGEVAVELEPLGVPAEGEHSCREIEASEAVALFVARTRAMRFDFELSEADAPAVSEIVRRVDGIPLAIELCAARTGVLAPKQILARLARRFDLLVTGDRGVPARRATLRGAIDWSWDLLEPWEKDALAQCSVFRGGFSLEAAESVLDLGGARAGAFAREPPPVLDVLQSLHEKSLLRAFDPQGAAGERRYGLLESIRQYAEERLDELGAAAAAAERHASFFLDLAGPRGAPPPPSADVRRLALEADNLMAVCTRALARRPLTPADADAALRGLLLLEPVLLMCSKGRLEPYVEMLDAALSAKAPPLDPLVRARALYTRALADMLRGRAECFFSFQRAVEGAQAAGSALHEGLALTKLALLFEHGDRPDEAGACFERARAIARELGDAALHADWMLMRGAALVWRSRAADAVWHEEQAVLGFASVGDLRGQSVASVQLALAWMNLGRMDDAELAAGRALALLRSTEDRRTEGYGLGILGRIQQAQGRFAEARASLAAALSIHRAVGDRWSEALHVGFMGNVLFEERKLEEAQRAYSEAVAMLRCTAEPHYLAIFLAALGAVEADLGQREVETSRFEAAAAALERVRVLATKVTVELFRAHADTSLARAAAAAGDLAAVERSRRAAIAKIAVAEAPAPDGASALAQGSEDIRFALRILQRDLGQPVASPRAPAVPPPVLSATVAMLVVGSEARWFRLNGGKPVLLLKARAARLVLSRLVRLRIDAPGRALTLDELFEAGWPDQRIPRSAAANRVYVTLTKLRQLGLGSILQSRDDGFLLDPTVVVLEALDPTLG
jgi:predicted ATPase